MTTVAPRRALRGSLGVQLFLLLWATLFIGQAVIVVVALLLPPPQPQTYSTLEIADRLQGQSVEPQHGRTLLRRVQKEPPNIRDPVGLADEDPMRAMLAQLLHVAPGDVRFGGALHEFRERHGPPAELHGGPFKGALVRELGPNAQGVIAGRFVAALRLDTNEWAVVEPASDPFPTTWQQRLLLWFVASCALLALIAAWFARRVSAPMRAFADAADRLGRQLDGPPLALTGPNELRVAGAAFNRMQARLVRYVDDRTQMLAAIAHDLRTPLTRLRFRLEQAPPNLRGPAQDDIAEMEAMVRGVLEFVRDGRTAGPPQRIELSSLLESLVEDMRVTGADVELTDALSLVVEGDGTSLRRMFANLVDNAIKYGQVARLSLARDGDEAVVRIEDRGPGLTFDQLERVFEPFYRVETSRNRETGGLGLGLAVVRTIVRAHGGDVTLANGANGLVATVRLPLSA